MRKQAGMAAGIIPGRRAHSPAIVVWCYKAEKKKEIVKNQTTLLFLYITTILKKEEGIESVC